MKVRHGTVVAYAALFIALGGTATALQGKNTVFSDDIAPKNVKAADIAPKAVKPKHLAVPGSQLLVTGIEGELHQGASGEVTPGTSGAFGSFWQAVRIRDAARIGDLDVYVSNPDGLSITIELVKNFEPTGISCSTQDFTCSDKGLVKFKRGDSMHFAVSVAPKGGDPVPASHASISLAVR